MHIKIIDVTSTSVPKKFGQGTNEQLSVTFENLTFGKTDAKKFLDWATDKEVFEVLKGATKGDFFDVVTEKNAKGYIDWKGITAADAVEAVTSAVKPAAAAKGAGPAARAAKGAQIGGTWDIKNQLDRERFDFEKAKQPLIVRQSSLSTAVAMLTAGGKVPAIEAVLEAAEAFEQYVYRTSNCDGIATMTDDIPE